MLQKTSKAGKIAFKRNIPMLIVGLVFFAFAVWAMIYFRMFITPNNKIERRNMALYLVLMALPVPLTQIKLTVSERANVLIRALYMLLGMCAAMVMFNLITWGQALSGMLLSWGVNPVLSWGVNLAIVAGIFSVVWIFTWNVKVTVPVASTLFCVLAYAYRAVYRFRGTPVTPEDLLTIGTAANVAGQYTYWFRGLDMACLCVVGALITLGGVLPSPKPRVLWAKVSKAVCVALSIGLVVVMCTSSFLTSHGFYIPAWMPEYPTVAAHQGPLATFVTEIVTTAGLKPSGYNEQALAQVQQTLDQYESVAAQDSGIRPNVIVVMNESFSDYAAIWQLETSQDILPFWHSLSENAIKGKLFVSVLGGQTCNTEHHFLTSTQFAPLQKTSLYHSVKENTPSLAWQLKSLGYQTVAIHPAIGRNYDRDTIYPMLGFDTFLDKRAFEGSEKYRDQYSDRACYQKIIELYEKKDADDPLFVFTLTMQNHSPHNTGLEPTVVELYNEDEGLSIKTEYMNCLHESDVAFSELVGYFEKQQEPTIILMFGDHTIPVGFQSPKCENMTEVETRLVNYTTTYAIWANYPIQTQEWSLMSDHYLAPLLLKTAGLPLTEYDAFLLDVAKQYPVVTAMGFADSQGNLTVYQNTTQTEPLLQQMDIMRYNRLYDSSERLKELAAGMPNEQQ